MVRRNKPKQLSPEQLGQFLAAAERLHLSIVDPLISPQCDHYRSLQSLHEALLKTVREVTGKEVAFIRWNGTGPVMPSTAG
ncbi:MAG: hypothetical protein EOS58_17025 [Mesorhizobium sp.]|nr:MAG: hypothetical protein EOS58_17025 [Mesorhizobium sp.]